MDIYTKGWTPQGIQVSDGVELNTNATAPAGVPSNDVLAPRMVQAEDKLAGMQTKDARQDYITNSPLPGLQVNYDDLVRQLFNYDQMLQGSGQVPATPDDVLSFGRVPASTLQQLTPESVNNPTPYLDNPSFSVAKNVAQNNDLLSVLDNLNSALSKEMTSARGKYASNVQAQLQILNGIKDVMNYNNEQSKLNYEFGLKYGPYNLREKIRKDAQAGMTLDDIMKSYKTNPFGITPDDILGIYNTFSKYGMAKEDPNELQRKYSVSQNAAYGKELSAGEKTVVDSSSAGLTLLDQFIANGLLDVDTGPTQGRVTDTLKNTAPGLINKKVAQFQSDMGPIRDQVINVLNGTSAPSNEVERVMGWIPDAYKSKEENQRNAQSLKDWLLSKYKTSAGRDYVNASPSKQKGPIDTGSTTINSLINPLVTAGSVDRLGEADPGIRRLRDAGASSAEIEAFKKRKGLK